MKKHLGNKPVPYSRDVEGTRIEKDFSMKTRAAVRPKKQPAAEIPPGLSATEQDLVRHVHNGYQLETDSLDGDPLLRSLKDSEVIRPLSATRNTIKALEERGLIALAGGDDPLRIVWQLQKNKTAKKSRR
jgi:hypothetical protein